MRDQQQAQPVDEASCAVHLTTGQCLQALKAGLPAQARRLWVRMLAECVLHKACLLYPDQGYL